MSRAFVKDADQDPDELLPDRAVSVHPNFVTADGLQQIEAEVRRFEAERQAARSAEDAGAVARAARELRYWTQRLASARVIEPARQPSIVRFGVRLTLQFDDGARQSFRIVGEDQADPAHGLLSYVSPLAKAAMGAAVGDRIQILGREAQVLRIES